MTTELASTSPTSRAAARNVFAIFLNQVPQVAGSVLFVVLIPRGLGTEIYGQLTFCFAFITIFQAFGDLGYSEIFARFLPEVRQQAGEAGIRAMVRELFQFKTLVGLGLGLIAALIALWLEDWITPVQAGLMGLSVAVRIWAIAPFPLLLGLGETAKWSVESTWRQIVVTFLLFATLALPSLTLSLAVIAVHEIIFLGLGLWWTRRWLSPKSEVRSQESEVRSQKTEVESLKSEVQSPKSLSGVRLPSSVLRPSSFVLGPSSFLRFGFIFSLANIALVVMFRFSLIVVEKLTHSRPEVAFYDLALGALLLIYTLLGQIAYTFIPLLTQLQLNNRLDEADVWLGRFVRYTTLFVALGVGGMWAVSEPAAPLLFGAAFEPTASALRAMAIGLLPLPLAWAGVILSALDKRPLRKAWAALIGLAVFLVGAVALRHSGATGMAFAFAGALMGYALGFGPTLGRAIRSGGVGWGIALGATSLFIPLFFLKFSSLFVALTAWSIVTLIYLIIVLALRVVTPEEVKQMIRVFRG